VDSFLRESASDMGLEHIFSESRPVAFVRLDGRPAYMRLTARCHLLRAVRRAHRTPPTQENLTPSVDVCKNQSDTKKQRHGANVANGSSDDLPRCHSNIRDQYRGSIFAEFNCHGVRTSLAATHGHTQ